MASPEESYNVGQAPINSNNQPSGLHQVSARSYGEQYDVPAYQEPPPRYPVPPYEEYSQPPPYYGSVQVAGQPQVGTPRVQRVPQRVITAVPATRRQEPPPPLVQRYPAPPYEEYSHSPPYYGSVQVAGQPQVGPPRVQRVPPQAVITAVPSTRQGRVPVRNQYQEVHGENLAPREAVPLPTGFDQFCDTCSCHVNCCTFKEDRSPASRLLLRKARREGWWMFWSMILPLIFSMKFVVIWIIIQLVLSIGLVALSAVAYLDAKDGHDVDLSNLIHLIASCAFVFLSGIDALLPDLGFTAPAQINATYKWSTTTAMLRLGYTAVCLYVAAMCDAVHLAIKFPNLHERHGGIVFGRAIATFVFFFGLVHLATVVVIGAAFRVMNILIEKDRSKSIGYSGVRFTIHFAVHFLGQTLVQALLLLTIGARLHYDNSNSNGDLIQIDAFLWTMIIAGFVIPIAGTLLFFVTHVYWVQEFLVGVFTIVLSVANGPDSEFGDPLDLLRPNDSQKQRLQELKRNTDVETLKREAMLMRRKDSSYKILLPFKAPIRVILCILYTLFLIVFSVFALLHHSGGEDDTPFAPTHGWNIFYYVTLGFYAALNVYGLVIGLYWLLVIIATAMMLLVLLFILRRCMLDEVTANMTACCHGNINTIG